MPIFKKITPTYISSFEEKYGNKHILRPDFHCVKHAVPFFSGKLSHNEFERHHEKNATEGLFWHTGHKHFGVQVSKYRILLSFTFA